MLLVPYVYLFVAVVAMIIIFRITYDLPNLTKHIHPLTTYVRCFF